MTRSAWSGSSRTTSAEPSGSVALASIPSSSSRRNALIAARWDSSSSAVQLTSSVCPVRSSLINLDMPSPFLASEYTPLLNWPRDGRGRNSGTLRPPGDRAQVAARLGGGEHVGGCEPRLPRVRRIQAEELRAGDAALPVGRAARRAPEDLFGRRRDRPLPPPPRLSRRASDGLRRLWPAGREQ